MDVTDLVYREVDGELLLGRLYQPQGAKALVVEVHGGAWVMNDRLANAAIHHHLAANDIAVFALDFRMAPKHRYPAAIEDVAFALGWARRELKPKRMGALATSSGAQVLLCAVLPSSEPLDFLVACWPILDPLARYRMAKAKGMQNLLDAHNAYFPDEAAMAEGNPHLIVERGEAKTKPPMLILQGTADENVEHHRADLFAKRYGDARVVKFDGQPHTFIPKDPSSPASRSALDAIVRFVLEKGEPQPRRKQ
jgi:acetyl esterase/lipase